MQCELCDKNFKVTLDIVEGLAVCAGCQIELGLVGKRAGSMQARHNRTMIRTMAVNIHMNGCRAADPRPYGRLPGNN